MRGLGLGGLVLLLLVGPCSEGRASTPEPPPPCVAPACVAAPEAGRPAGEVAAAPSPAPLAVCVGPEPAAPLCPIPAVPQSVMSPREARRWIIAHARDLAAQRESARLIIMSVELGEPGPRSRYGGVAVCAPPIDGATPALTDGDPTDAFVDVEIEGRPPSGSTIEGDPAAFAADGDPAAFATDGDPAAFAADGDPAAFAAGGDPAAFAADAPAADDAAAVTRIVAPPAVVTTERRRVDFVVQTVGPDARVWASGLPPGARFVGRRLTWVPDFIQGGRDWLVTFRAGGVTAQTIIRVRDSVRPPAPQVQAEATFDGYKQLTLIQTTDRFLDSPGRARRRLEAVVVLPEPLEPGRRYPVQLRLHGFNGVPEPVPAADRIRVYPADPENTYWWGYAATLPGRRPGRRVPNYTQRRALHLLAWVLDRYPQADPDRVYVDGESMGGTGALALGLLYGRHFAAVESTIGQVVARNHRPRRIKQLSRLWGGPRRNLPDADPADPMGVWDRLDLVRALAERPEAREQFLFTKHGKDDTVIHFGAVVMPSPRVRLSFYEALQRLHIGHLVVWDEGGHARPDPILGDLWWDDGWDRMTDPETFLRRDLAFAAFSRSSVDDDPGDGRGRGGRKFDANRGYAGNWTKPGDTGWNGDLAGARNRYLRWDSRRIVDRVDRFEIPLRVKLGAGEAPPGPGYPPLGGRFEGELPVIVDVTPRRLQAFHIEPGEQIRWSFGRDSGAVTADETGAVTVPRLRLGPTYQRLTLTRSDPGR